MFKSISKLFFISAITLTLTACPAEKEIATDSKQTNDSTSIDENAKQTQVLMQTSLGDIELMLYNETPLHRDNFIKLVNEKFYDSLLFHRVIPQFMVQGGDPNSKNATATQSLGDGGPGYTIPAEFNSKFIHKKGALSAARQGDQVNPEKASSGSQFYLVQGQTYTEEQLNNMLLRINEGKFQSAVRAYLFQPENADKLKQAQDLSRTNPNGLNDFLAQFKDSVSYTEVNYTPEQKKMYTTVGGTPHLDGDYTVYGEVTKGLDVIDKIAATPTAAANRPSEDVHIISVTIIE